MVRYVPDRGDLIWATLSGEGHEQSGRRPALVLTSAKYNKITGLAIVCPLTTKSKPYPFVVPLVVKGKTGFVLCDQVRILDLKSRKISFIDKVADHIIQNVQKYIVLLITR